MKPRLELPRAARRRLEKLDRKRPDADVRVRIRVVLKVAAGCSCNAAHCARCWPVAPAITASSDRPGRWRS